MNHEIYNPDLAPPDDIRYLAHHLEPREQKIEFRAILNKDVPLIENPITQPEGEVHVTKGNIDLNFSYRSFEVNDITAMCAFANGLGEERDWGENWRVITSLTLYDREKHHKSADFIPKGDTRVVVSKHKVTDTFCYNPQYNAVIVDENITKPKVVLGTLHEIGHTQADNALESAHIRVKMLEVQEITSKEAAILIRNERDSWAPALREIRPFIGVDPTKCWLTRKQVWELMRSSLASYSEIQNLLPIEQRRQLNQLMLKHDGHFTAKIISSLRAVFEEIVK